MKRLLRFSIAAFVLIGVLIFAAALAGGLMDSDTFTAGSQPPATPVDPAAR
ncbi:hypothetical protein [uncultured Brevundimonas sp.]|uniref:hypothetical protein n=1 Tax=uncultured Brevundimonas sp. TaxID=213418 RepID=UPI0030EBD62A